MPCKLEVFTPSSLWAPYQVEKGGTEEEAEPSPCMLINLQEKHCLLVHLPHEILYVMFTTLLNLESFSSGSVNVHSL